MATGKSTKITKVCETCGKVFKIAPSYGVGRFCSHKCWHASRVQSTFESQFKKFLGEMTESGCVLWKGSVNVRGRPVVNYGDGLRMYAHRASYIINVGPIPDGLCILHCCDNPLCVNPVHLFLGTHTDNMEDMARKGRSNRGENVSTAKLNEDKVREIRRRYAQGESGPKLGNEFGVSAGTIRLVAKRLKWTHVTDLSHN